MSNCPDDRPSAETQPDRARKRMRPIPLMFIGLAVVATLCLAWWQWMRFKSGSGTFQNLGYALQWPLFGAFIVYAYRSYIKYENELLDESTPPDVFPDDNQAAIASADATDAAGTGGSATATRPATRASTKASAHRATKARKKRMTSIDESFLPARPTMDVDTYNALNQPERSVRRRSEGSTEDHD